jgi:hypothetical protein
MRKELREEQPIFVRMATVMDRLGNSVICSIYTQGNGFLASVGGSEMSPVYYDTRRNVYTLEPLEKR